MSLDINFALEVLYPAASAAYLMMSVPTPPLFLPAGYALVGPIMANPLAAAHAMAQAEPEQQRLANVMVRQSSIFGLVCWNAGTQTALVALRGTETCLDWLHDFEAMPEPWLANPTSGLVHMGFQLVYEHLCLSLRELLNTGCVGATRIIVTGHSLGGALALLAAFDIFKNTALGVTPELYTFAGPRTGGPDFVESFNAAIPVCGRIVNFMDFVPQVPLPPLYLHIGMPEQELLVHGGFRPWDITYAHHLTTYLAGLQKVKRSGPAPLPEPTPELVAAVVAPLLTS